MHNKISAPLNFLGYLKTIYFKNYKILCKKTPEKKKASREREGESERVRERKY